MLTADLVAVRTRDGVLRVVDLHEKELPRAHALAASYIAILERSVGLRRDEIEPMLSAIACAAGEKRLALGLRKLLDDRSTYESAPDLDPIALRRAVFVRAAAMRRSGAPFDRDAVLTEIGARLEVPVDAVERGLYADLRGAQRLLSFDAIGPNALCELHRQSQAQAILLRAVRVVAQVQCATPAASRALFHRLKFLRLLHRIEPLEGGGHRIEIDGPFSLFDAVTKYGLQLALVLPALRNCDAWKLEAEIRWGKERKPLLFRCDGGRVGDDDTIETSDEITTLLRALKARIKEEKLPWRVEPATDIVDLPGIGLSVPDLVFSRVKSKVRVFVEVMGYWSRDAVWRRVELAENGLATPMVFAVSSRLRVSAEVLDGDAPAALYVYKGTMSARALLEKVEQVAARKRPRARA